MVIYEILFNVDSIQALQWGGGLHFAMNLSETFRINVNMDFAHTNHGRFLI